MAIPCDGAPQSCSEQRECRQHYHGYVHQRELASSRHQLIEVSLPLFGHGVAVVHACVSLKCYDH